MMPEPDRWKKIASEATVIVGSILLAFAIDAWWENLSDQRQETALMKAVLVDFEASRIQYDEMADWQGRIVESLAQILSWAENGSVPSNFRDQFDRRLGHTFYREVYDPPLGAVETILSSGRLDRFGDSRFVTALTRWKALVEDLQQKQQAGINHFYDVLYPFLLSRVNLQDLDKDIPYPGGLPWAQQETMAYKLVSDREFHGIIYLHWVLYWNIENEMPAVSDAISAITEMAQEAVE